MKQPYLYSIHLAIVIFFTGSLFSEPSPIPEIPSDEVVFPLPYFSPISGTFAEIRSNHLHMGSDFKSYGLNGHSILSTFDGYVEEIGYSKLGYGLYLFLYSPSYKIKARYAHLHSFGGDLADLELLRRALLLMGEKDGFRLKLNPGMFTAPKGIPFGKTGESGTGVPHLHLEFHTDKGIVNPLNFPELHQKDTIPPTISSFYIEGGGLTKPLLLQAKETGSGNYQLLDENGNPIESVSLSGKVRFRIGGYDLIRSRNRNNVFGMDLFLDEKPVYSRQFDFLYYKEAENKHLFYDANRSSYSPPVYFYHLYEISKESKSEAYSLDFSEFPEKTVSELKAGLRDAAGNKSYVRLKVKHEAPVTALSNAKQSLGKKFFSNDRLVQFDLSKNESSGNGSVEIEEEDPKQLPFVLPKGLILKSKVYKLETNQFSWKGNGTGEFNTEITITNKEYLSFWDQSAGRFSSVSAKRKSNGFTFSLAKLGYLMILEDKAPPTVLPLNSMARHIELPEVRDQCFEDKYYSLSDSGVGAKRSVNLLLDGQNYPYEYDADKESIRVSLPKSLHKEKPYLLLEVRAFDWAGNESEPFTDLIATGSWKSEYYASCPVKE
ncbi:M23 family metallopeptidase [Leptospira idonii]|uniref:M23 family peptidase n=1 Tax=Leptospira idonii TaxID=1193500 RepID=A0A4R9LYH4_9LEPT|nr:M23 family peptidase [Leptospira idonii]TGN17641.1 M23 family peptidase [Leptospira idonii]